ncbi:DUF4112 domain-containing protein [Romeria aff. gracilis LEGE 07310]|uniref:DUF4112 domain-containing protein n=1 Tax=Vasconcelosia minhoensis LEGE 07310 TaxID=915328 RepID=A0A8J7AI86_9CYAN|nr:DUF4112 domain-containing protein [Romeria gracilis]MBE9079586.1 DUF4112 domain-containing protein [Romeria aff. gracilis LEGE 07310]
MDTSARLRNLNRIRRLSRLMDTAFRIPGIGLRIGLDPIIGLVPGLGDLIATAVSAYILFLAARFRLPGKVFGRMVFNVGLEFVIGAIPLLGDIFDAFFKSNVRNLALLEAHLQAAEPDLEKASLSTSTAMAAGD